MNKYEDLKNYMKEKFGVTHAQDGLPRTRRAKTMSADVSAIAVTPTAERPTRVRKETKPYHIFVETAADGSHRSVLLAQSSEPTDWIENFANNTRHEVTYNDVNARLRSGETHLEHFETIGALSRGEARRTAGEHAEALGVSFVSK